MYKTLHTLHVKNARPEDEDNLIEAMDEVGILDYAFDSEPFRDESGILEFNYCDAVSWRQRDADMIKLSKRFPCMIFKLHGEGEIPGDLWNNYYQDGICEFCRAEIVYPEPEDIEWDD